MNRPMYEYQDLTPETDFKTFKCADSDLNDFLYEEAKGYQSQLLAKTYLVVNSENQDVIAYFRKIKILFLFFIKNNYLSLHRIMMILGISQMCYV